MFFKGRKGAKKAENPAKTLVLIPAYKEDFVIVQSAESFQKQNYPQSSYKTVVIADELKQATILKLQVTGVSVCCLPISDKRNKARAINYLLSTLYEDFDNVIVMDADNVVEADFLQRMNNHFANGAVAVQARRVAKNSTNKLSELDSFSEVINNHIFRKGQRVLGFSSSLIGSGMGFEFSLFKKLMNGMDVFSGFDKELELRLLKNKTKIEYAEDILVYDEKVSDQTVFVNQRRRWIYAQWHFLTKNFFNAIYQVLVHGNFDYANKVAQFMLLPRVIAIGVSALLIALTPLVSIYLFVATTMVTLMLGISLALPLYGKTSFNTVAKTLTELPRTLNNMVLALLTSAKASNKFLHTPHNSK